MRNRIAPMVLVVVLAIAAQPPAGTRIHGHIFEDSSGTPIRGAKVTLIEQEVVGHRTAGTATTDERGVYEFEGISPEGSYTITVEKSGYLLGVALLSQAQKNVDVRLKRVATISGRVLDSKGRPIKKAVVEILHKSYMYGELTIHAPNRGFAETDDQGLYRISGMEGGKYYVRAAAKAFGTTLYPSAYDLNTAQTVELTAGSERTLVNVALHAAPTFRLSGTLVDAETQSAPSKAFLEIDSTNMITGTGYAAMILRGRFQAEGLRPGRYFAKFHWGTSGPGRTAIFPFEISNADRTGVTFTAGPRVSVSGHLNMNGHKLPSGTSVYLESSAVALRAHGGNYAQAYIQDDGSFRLDNVEAGGYTLRARLEGPDYLFAAGRNLTVVGGKPVSGIGVDVEVGGAVSGRAVDRSGKPMTRTVAVLQSLDPQKLAHQQYQFVYNAGNDGKFFITGVIPGDYLLFAWQGDSGIVGDPELFAYASQHARHLTVPRGRTIRANATELHPPR